MSSRFRTSTVRRSVSCSMVARNSSICAGDHVTSRWRRLDADALMPASGVRRSCDTAWSSAERSSSVRARRSARPASAARWRRTTAAPSCAVKAPSTRQVLVPEGAPVEGDHDLGAVEGTHDVGGVGVDRRPPARARLRQPRRARAAQDSHAVDIEGVPQVLDEVGDRVGLGQRARQAGQVLGLRGGPCRLLRAPGRRRHEPADDHRDHQEHGEGEQRVGLVDGQRVHRFGEEPVGHQERRQRAGDRRRHAPHAGAGHHEQQVEEQRAGEVGVVLAGAQADRQQGEADAGDGPGQPPPPRRQRGAAGAVTVLVVGHGPIMPAR